MSALYMVKHSLLQVRESKLNSKKTQESSYLLAQIFLFYHHYPRL
jgi:hypothetical protein